MSWKISSIVGSRGLASTVSTPPSFKTNIFAAFGTEPAKSFWRRMQGPELRRTPPNDTKLCCIFTVTPFPPPGWGGGGGGSKCPDLTRPYHGFNALVLWFSFRLPLLSYHPCLVQKNQTLMTVSPNWNWKVDLRAFGTKLQVPEP